MKKAKINFLIDSPPVTVRVANSYSATENPALLCAVTLRLYQVAGLRSNTTKFPPACNRNTTVKVNIAFKCVFAKTMNADKTHLDAVRHKGPVLLILGLVLDDEVDDRASSIHPRV